MRPSSKYDARIFQRGRALVTGASSGIGVAFARRLARDGYDLILVARRRECLEALASELQREHDVSVEVLVADLRAPDDVHMVERRIVGTPPITLLVNSAGVADDEEVMIQLGAVALVRLTRAALPGMIDRGTGSIINVASAAAFRTSLGLGPGLLMTTYSATKAFAVTFCQRLHEELRGTGVRVQVLCPGRTPTEMANPEALADIVPLEAWMPVDDVVHASLAGLKQGELVCVPGLTQTDLLDELDPIKDAIVAQAATTGVLASRYLSG
jgi:short-subunit dehydrogenase